MTASFDMPNRASRLPIYHQIDLLGAVFFDSDRLTLTLMQLHELGIELRSGFQRIPCVDAVLPGATPVMAKSPAGRVVAILRGRSVLFLLPVPV